MVISVRTENAIRNYLGFYTRQIDGCMDRNNKIDNRWIALCKEQWDEFKLTPNFGAKSHHEFMSLVKELGI